ncbi:MAG: FKBP-type peptidyl-prolyl cis-trans isomerase [Chitinophagales bacterium]
MKLKLLFLILSTILISNACKKESQAEIDQQKIEEYISTNNIDSVQISSTGLYYKILRTGNSTYPTISNQVTVNYKGYFLDGKVFDSGDNKSFPLSRVIAGWQEGLQYIGEGGKIQLFVPSALFMVIKVLVVFLQIVYLFEVDLIDVL